MTDSRNVDLVRSIYADWERGDFSRAEWADPDMEFVFADGPEPVRGRGAAAMWGAWRDVLSAWREYRAVAEEYRELDDGSIVALTAFHARGRASEIEVRQVLARGASVMWVDGGKVTKLVLYYSRDRALADLGLTGHEALMKTDT
jgi:ketosteroid isomerase-like protein